MDPHEMYYRLGRILETFPDFSQAGELSRENHKWIGRARLLVARSGDLQSKNEFDYSARHIESGDRKKCVNDMNIVLHRLLAEAELEIPIGAQGSFIPAGNRFDAYSSITKLFREAKKDLFIVDPYMDESVLTEFGESVPNGVTFRLLSDPLGAKGSLKPASVTWSEQHGTARPLEVRLAQARQIHDRAVIVDRRTAWTLTQSLKDFARKSPAEIIRADDIAVLKIDAYESIWVEAQHFP